MASPRTASGLAPASRSERWLPLAGIALLLGGVTLFAAGLGRFIPPCAFREITGAWCPGCGSGRVARALLDLDVAAAWRANPLALLVLPALGYALVRETLLAWGVAAWPAPRSRAWVGWTILAVTVSFWVLRNIPLWPFSLLAPR